MSVDDPLSESLESTTCRVLAILDDPAHCLVVAVRKNDVLGYALAQDYGPSARRDWSVVRLHDLYVGQPARRRGVGRRLHEAIVTWSRGRPAVHWLEWQASEDSVPFYASLGHAPDYKSDLAEHPFFEVNFTV